VDVGKESGSWLNKDALITCKILHAKRCWLGSPPMMPFKSWGFHPRRLGLVLAPHFLQAAAGCLGQRIMDSKKKKETGIWEAHENCPIAHIECTVSCCVLLVAIDFPQAHGKSVNR